jgi:hypothetical protein
MTTVVVSPHFDDAVLSCWSLLDGGGDVDVVTVFTLGPVDPELVTSWDSASGVSSQVRMEQRAEENRRALALAGRVATDLGCREYTYDDGMVDVAALAAALAGADLVYLPAGTAVEPRWVHADHLTVRDAGRAIRPDAALYADQPYNLYQSGLRLPEHLRESYLEADEVELSVEKRERKVAAIAEYAGELTQLADMFLGFDFSDPDSLPRETFWRSRL